MVRIILDWLDHRTGLETAVKDFMLEEIPASSGWPQVFGSMAMFFFMLQAVTGLLLSFNYAPTPGEAYNSLQFIMNELTGGRFIRGLHHWGASMMIVVVALHMAQVFLWGAYKKPREATWMVGVVLLLITLGFGLTGYLLPWDNRAYWGTVVATQIAAKSPGIGDYLTRLLASADGIGVVTFARFYAMHVMLLPAAMVGLMMLHVILVRRHGVAPAPGDTLPKKKFYPGQVFKDTVAIFVGFCILMALAITMHAPLEKLADPTDISYIPRPEWYFLWLFQMLKLFEGPMEVVGTHIIPGLAVGLLMLLPFVDRGKVARLADRKLAFAALLLVATALGGLTTAALNSAPPSAVSHGGETAGAAWQTLPPSELAGLGHFRKQNCLACHAVGAQGGKLGPDLLQLPQKRTIGELVAFFKNPQQLRPGTNMPPVTIPGPQLNDLAAFVVILDAGNAQGLLAAPKTVAEGAVVYQNNRCNMCHIANGNGSKLGPPLNGVGKKRARQWLLEHFVDPQKLSPGSTMPPYRLPEKDLAALTDFLVALP
ncbi:MAG: cytochrome b N-terminal domain-containing protein [Acidobacteria bacterium]|nr:cytochrome b N-terminal domain-containing protein [Acidobacteriota bacterium]